MYHFIITTTGLFNTLRTSVFPAINNPEAATFLLGLLTSILLFDSMNLLYFEQFRKEIFIKRLSGMRFEEVHFNYLFSQICVLGVALVFLIFLIHHLIMSLLIVSLFIINMFTILYKQTLTESRTSVSVLKGK